MKIISRKLLPNEVRIDIAGKTKKQVLNEAINIIDKAESLTEDSYKFGDENNYLS